MPLADQFAERADEDAPETDVDLTKMSDDTMHSRAHQRQAIAGCRGWAPQCRQIHADQPDRGRGSPADRPRGRDHPRCDFPAHRLERRADAHL